MADMWKWRSVLLIVLMCGHVEMADRRHQNLFNNDGHLMTACNTMVQVLQLRPSDCSASTVWAHICAVLSTLHCAVWYVHGEEQDAALPAHMSRVCAATITCHRCTGHGNLLQCLGFESRLPHCSLGGGGFNHKCRRATADWCHVLRVPAVLRLLS